MERLMRSREQRIHGKMRFQGQTGWNRTLGAKGGLILTDYGSMG
jgi:hypothetical protein